MQWSAPLRGKDAAQRDHAVLAGGCLFTQASRRRRTSSSCARKPGLSSRSISSRRFRSASAGSCGTCAASLGTVPERECRFQGRDPPAPVQRPYRQSPLPNTLTQTTGSQGTPALLVHRTCRTACHCASPIPPTPSSGTLARNRPAPFGPKVSLTLNRRTRVPDQHHSAVRRYRAPPGPTQAAVRVVQASWPVAIASPPRASAAARAPARTQRETRDARMSTLSSSQSSETIGISMHGRRASEVRPWPVGATRSCIPVPSTYRPQAGADTPFPADRPRSCGETEARTRGQSLSVGQLGRVTLRSELFTRAGTRWR